MVGGSSSNSFHGGTQGNPENPYSQTVVTQDNSLLKNFQVLQLWVVQVAPLRINGLQCAVSPGNRSSTTALEPLRDNILEEAVCALDTNLYMDHS